MDPLDKIHQDNTAQVIQFPRQKQDMGFNERPHIGMVLYAVDQKTGIAEEAKYKAVSLPSKRDLDDLVTEETRKQLIVESDKWYVWCINKKNAERKFFKMLKEARNRKRGL